MIVNYNLPCLGGVDQVLILDDIELQFTPLGGIDQVSILDNIEL